MIYYSKVVFIRIGSYLLIFTMSLMRKKKNNN